MKLLLLLSIILLTGCASPPREELQSARMALTQAQHADAETLTPEAYRKALEALRRGEALVRNKDYTEARTILPLAEEQARHAVVLAEKEKERLERQRAAAEAEAAAKSPRPPVKTISPPMAPAQPTPQPEQEAEQPSPSIRHVVEAEETLPSIAAREEVYGDELLWPLLYQANRDQIRDPRRIYPGQALTIPRGLAAVDLEEIRERARRSEIFTSTGQRSASGADRP